MYVCMYVCMYVYIHIYMWERKTGTICQICGCFKTQLTTKASTLAKKCDASTHRYHLADDWWCAKVNLIHSVGHDHISLVKFGTEKDACPWPCTLL